MNRHIIIYIYTIWYMIFAWYIYKYIQELIYIYIYYVYNIYKIYNIIYIYLNYNFYILYNILISLKLSKIDRYIYI